MPTEAAAGSLDTEIASQPELWVRAAARGAAVRAGAPGSDRLPPHGGRLAVLGCGTSLYIGQAFAALRESLGHGETDAFTPSELPPRRRYDALLAISRSGTTTEVVRAVLDRGREDTYAVCGVSGSPLATAAGAVSLLPEADEASVVQTRFATTALALLRAHLGDDPAEAVEGARRALAESLPVDPAAGTHFVFLGSGWTVGLAREAALKMQEMANVVAQAYPAPEYLHGPISAATARTVIWALGAVDAHVLAAARRAGAAVVDRDEDPMAELVAVHRVARALARAHGVDPAFPRHLTRSIVLPE